MASLIFGSNTEKKIFGSNTDKTPR